MRIWIPSREDLESKEDENGNSDGGGVDIPISKDTSERLIQLQHHIIEGQHLEGVCKKVIRISVDVSKVYEASTKICGVGRQNGTSRKERALRCRAYAKGVNTTFFVCFYSPIRIHDEAHGGTAIGLTLLTPQLFSRASS
jgi:hypothetical protein